MEDDEKTIEIIKGIINYANLSSSAINDLNYVINYIEDKVKNNEDEILFYKNLWENLNEQFLEIYKILKLDSEKITIKECINIIKELKEGKENEK